LENLIDNIIEEFPGHVIPIDPAKPNAHEVFISVVSFENNEIELNMQDVKYISMDEGDRLRAYTDRKTCGSPPSIE
jgi:hypothetical protein